MRVLILTATSQRHQHFCIEIACAFDDVYIIQEPKATTNPLGSRVRRFLAGPNKRARIRNFGYNRIFRNSLQRLEQQRTDAESKWFSRASEIFQREFESLVISNVEDRNINDPKYVALIKKLQPDLVAVMGTSLLRRPLISIPKVAILNMHTGLSPYYRGSATNLWPFINRELQYCGVTVHKISTGIDSGDTEPVGYADWE